MEGRRRLDDLQAEITGAARSWDLSTATGSREFQRFLIAKLGEIVRVVQEADGDDTSKQALAAALATLYAAHGGGDDPAPPGRNPEPSADAPPSAPDLDGDPYLDALPADEWETEPWAAPPQPSAAPSMPAVPGFGGEAPGLGAMPSALPAGLPLTGLRPEPRDDNAAGDDGYPADKPDAEPEQQAGDETGDDVSPEAPRDDGPVPVRLPDGAVTTVEDPRLAAAMQAAAEGTPVAEAFRRQGLDIPPPGTPVTSPVDPARLRPGDIGVFTDRHALAVGEGKALLDGQLHLTENLRGPGFLGWMHLPLRSGEPAPAGEPVPAPTVVANLPGR